MKTKDTLKAVVSPDNATNKTVSYTLTDRNIATMTALADKSGVEVVASYPGTAKITATTEDNNCTDVATLVVNPVNKSDFTQTSTTTTLTTQWSLGGMIGTTGEEVTLSDRIRSQFIPVKPNAKYTVTKDGLPHQLNLFEFTADKVVHPDVPNGANRYVREFTVQPNTAYIRFVNQGNTDISSNIVLTETVPNMNKAYIDSRSGNPNLMKNSRDNMSYTIASNSGSNYPISRTSMTENGKNFVRIKRTSPELNPSIFSIFSNFSLPNLMTESLRGKTITVSFNARTSIETTGQVSLGISAPNQLLPNTGQTITLKTTWSRYSFTTTVPDTDTLDYTYIRANPSVINMQGTINDFYLDLCDYKWELGEVATPYSPAPEDFGIPHGQPNLLDKSSTPVVTNATTNQIGSTISVVENDLVGNWVSARISGNYIGSVDGYLVVRIYDSLGNTITSLSPVPAVIPAYTGTDNGAPFSFDFLEANVPSTAVTIRVYLLKSTSDTGSSITGLKAKVIKGKITDMDSWTPSFTDLSADKLEYNPYREAITEEYGKVSNLLITNPNEDVLKVYTNIYDKKEEIKFNFDLVGTLSTAYPEEFFGMSTDEKVAKVKEMVKKVTTRATISGSSGDKHHVELQYRRKKEIPITTESARNRSEDLAEVTLELDNALDYMDSSGNLEATVTTWDTGTQGINYFSIAEFNTNYYAHPNQPAINCVDIQLKPYTKYSLFTDDVPKSEFQNIFFMYIKETPKSNINGVTKTAPRELTTSTGVVTIGVRSDQFDTIYGNKTTEVGLGKVLIKLIEGGIDDEPIDNLITNGYGTSKDNTNWSNAEFNVDDKKVGDGSFTVTSSTGKSCLTNETIPVDFTHRYQTSYYAKTLLGTTNSYHVIEPRDEDGGAIRVPHCGGQIFTDANPSVVYLAKELKVGDTEIWVTDASQFPNDGGTTHLHSIALWNYKTNAGNMCGTYYTRYTMTAVYDDGAVDLENNIISLNTPWTIRNKSAVDGVFPVGHPISKTNDGSSYIYPAGVSNIKIPTDWTKYYADVQPSSTAQQLNRAIRGFRVGWTVNREATEEETTFFNGVTLIDLDTAKRTGAKPEGVHVSYIEQELLLTPPGENLYATPITITIKPD